jgi:hypothetical protein
MTDTMESLDISRPEKPKPKVASQDQLDAFTALRAALAQADTEVENLRQKRQRIDRAIYDLARGAITPAGALKEIQL